MEKESSAATGVSFPSLSVAILENEVDVVMFDENQLPNPPEHTMSGKEMERVVDEDIARFNKFFGEKLKNGNLSGPEKSIIKTYIYWKTHSEEEILERLGV